jgi:hypothetical protein
VAAWALTRISPDPAKPVSRAAVLTVSPTSVMSRASPFLDDAYEPLPCVHPHRSSTAPPVIACLLEQSPCGCNCVDRVLAMRERALQSVQRGGGGSTPQISRVPWRRGSLPVSICSHLSWR